MKQSLRQKLNDWIKAEGGKVVSIDQIERQVRLWGYKISNYERRLRPSESPNLERVFKNGAIIGYRWKVLPENPKFTAEQFFKDFPPKVEEKEVIKQPNQLF